MELLFIILSIVNAMTIPLGVGASTVAIFNFFTAISDGTIDQKDRQFMSVTYVILRVAMVLILVSEVGLILLRYSSLGELDVSSFAIAQLILVGLLFANAILMTARLMSSTFGPAIQATSWYGLGFTSALVPLKLDHFSLYTFMFVYIICLSLVALLINWRMAHLKKRLPSSRS